MSKQGKVWGHTEDLFNKNNVEFHRIEAKKGGYSSKHKHVNKHNAFYVERGKLKITVWKKDYDLVDETVVETGEMTSVAPDDFHMFEALEDTVAYEIYWTELHTSDIIRENCGGINTD